MKSRIAVLVCACAFGMAWASLVEVSQAYAEGPSSKKEAANSTAPVAPIYDTDTIRIQGEQRYRANCGRCHAAPRKFPPRMMATVLRHMRVRATITDEDMRLVLFYMSQ